MSKFKKFIILLVMILSGCLNSVNKGPDDELDQNLTQVNKIQTQILPSVTNIPLDQRTKTLTIQANTIMTPVLTSVQAETPTDSPTLTPFPTLNWVDENRNILDIVKNNANCDMPCFWGIVPGESIWGPIHQYLISLNFEIDEERYLCKEIQNNLCLEYRVGKYVNETYFGFEANVQDGLVEIITSRRESTYHFYSIRNIMKNLGIPDEVYLKLPITSPNENSLPLWIVIVYEKYGLIIEYEVESRVLGDSIRSCPYYDKTENFVSVFTPKSEAYYLAKEQILFPDQPTPKYYRSIEEVTNLSIEMFYNLFIEDKSINCLETLQSNW